MDGVVLPPANSGYSVTRNPSLRSDLRISFLEMLDIVDGKVPNYSILDTRDPSSTWCSTPLCGTIAGTLFIDYKTEIVDVPFKSFLDPTYPGGTLHTNFTGVGLNSTTNTVVFCNSGYYATLAFFVLDGIFGWPVSYYDGSWLEWGQMADNTNIVNGKGIDPSSSWITDPNLSTRSAGTTAYNALGVGFYPDPPLSFDASVNAIEEEDAKYMSTGQGGGAGAGGAGGC